MTSIPEKNVEDRGKETWSNLPILPLWMIKDRLPFVENLTVAVVCKHWHYASQIYPRKDLQSADCRPIWLMRVRYDNKCRGNEQLTNYSTGKKYFVGSLSDTATTRVICSQKGWLLLAPQSNYKWPSSGMFLINPFTKQRYDLPIAMHGSIFFPPLTAAISVVNGIPNCVAIGSLDSSFLHNIDFYPLEFILKIAQPDGREWRTYTYDYGTRETNSEDCSSGMFIRNNHVYLIDKVGRTLAFDMIGTTWTNIVKEKGERNVHDNPTVLCDGAFIRIILKWDSVKTPKIITHFSFRKLNEDEGKWVILDNKELGGKCWYLSCCFGNHAYVAKENKTTEICHKLQLQLDDRIRYLRKYAVDKFAGGSAQLVSEDRLNLDDLNQGMIWVDLG